MLFTVEMRNAHMHMQLTSRSPHIKTAVFRDSENLFLSRA